jgi:hypothetical protein
LFSTGIAPGADAQRQTTNPSVYVSIHVTLTNSAVVLRPKVEPRGSTARFIVHNAAKRPIAFSVGSQTPGLVNRFGFTHVFKPGEHRILLVYLAVRGLLPYYVGRSYSGARGAQRGELLIGATCALCARPGPPPIP